MNTNDLKPVIGMEIHVELKTESKMFCSCPAEHFAVEPNTHTCPVCLGLPGALPVPNRQAVEWTLMIGLGLNCKISKNSKFDRKHYFYPDLPKGYQISQYDEPLCFKGQITTSAGDIGITRVHLEEDTAKLQHTTLNGQRVTLVDFNRSSVPLVEIVTEPDITSAKQAKEYAQKIYQLVRFLNVSDADMEKGSMRVEANISWGLDLGYKVEVKNINSFRFLEKAIDFELIRQKHLLEQGVIPNQETRGWNESKNETFSQRTKETAEDYRYFPEPDIPPMVFSESLVDTLREAMPVLPETIRLNMSRLYNIRPDYIDVLTVDKNKAAFSLEAFAQAKTAGVNPQEVAKLLVNKPESFNQNAKDLVASLKAHLSKPVASEAEVLTWVLEAIAANPEIVQKYQAGKTAVIGVLMGDVIRRSKGQAEAKTINRLLQDKLKK